MSKKGDIIQVHMLTSYPAVLLNRDDAGLAKRIPYGGVERTRVSSQCLKKHWRESDIVSGLGDLAVRSRRGYVEFVERPLIEQHGASEEAARLISEKLIELSLGSKASDKRPGETGNIVVLSDRELAYLASIGVRILESAREAGIEMTDA